MALFLAQDGQYHLKADCLMPSVLLPFRPPLAFVLADRCHRCGDAEAYEREVLLGKLVEEMPTVVVYCEGGSVQHIASDKKVLVFLVDEDNKYEEDQEVEPEEFPSEVDLALVKEVLAKIG